MRAVFLAMMIMAITATSVFAHHDIFGPIKAGDIKQVRYVLDQEPELANVRSSSGLTPLHMAALLGKHEIAVLLMERDAGIATTDTNGNTALHLAARSGSGDLIKALLDKGADRAARNHKGKTALDISVAAGREDLAEFLR